MSAHLPVLQVLVPLLAAPVCALLRSARAAAALAVLASWTTLAVALALLGEVKSAGVVSYAIGGWVPPIGIEYRVDMVNAWVLVIVGTIASVVSPYMVVSVSSEVERRRIPLFYAAYLLCLTGLLGIAVTGDVFNVFVFLEISSLSAYALIAMGTRRRALTAAFRYLVMGSVGATLHSDRDRVPVRNDRIAEHGGLGGAAPRGVELAHGQGCLRGSWAWGSASSWPSSRCTFGFPTPTPTPPRRSRHSWRRRPPRSRSTCCSGSS